MKPFHLVFGIFCCLLVIFFSCKKEAFITDSSARITVQTDSIRFDTVFTSVGSITRSFKVFNPNNGIIRFQNIRLMGGTASPFRMNVNGQSANQISQLELRANDSLYVFVSVTINPTNSLTPFVLRDSICFEYNNNKTFVQLEAFGQNARFIRNGRILQDTVWDNRLPYVILGNLTIETGNTLTLQAGTRLFMHADATLTVHGTLISAGTPAAPIDIRGDRLDYYYNDLPGCWPGIVFSAQSENNLLTYTHIRNAFKAIELTGQPAGSTPKLTLNQCTISQAKQEGMLCRNTTASLNNCLVYNCGSNFRIIEGGTYQLNHCTLAAFSTRYTAHQQPVFYASDIDLLSSSSLSKPLLVNMSNSIIWGEEGWVSEEIQTYRSGTTPFQIILDHCIYRSDNPPLATTTACLPNINPSFDSIQSVDRFFDFHHTKDPNAPGIDQGITTGLSIDLDGLNRPTGTAPDIGCYEKP
ncbi:MAG: choice-of-anchor Q domain-containing protein [Ferruginibacter sp.]